MSQFQILGRRPFPFKAIPIRFAYTNFPDTIAQPARLRTRREIGQRSLDSVKPSAQPMTSRYPSSFTPMDTITATF